MRLRVWAAPNTQKTGLDGRGPREPDLIFPPQHRVGSNKQELKSAATCHPGPFSGPASSLPLGAKMVARNCPPFSPQSWLLSALVQVNSGVHTAEVFMSKDFRASPSSPFRDTLLTPNAISAHPAKAQWPRASVLWTDVEPRLQSSSSFGILGNLTLLIF